MSVYICILLALGGGSQMIHSHFWVQGAHGDSSLVVGKAQSNVLFRVLRTFDIFLNALTNKIFQTIQPYRTISMVCYVAKSMWQVATVIRLLSLDNHKAGEATLVFGGYALR